MTTTDTTTAGFQRAAGTVGRPAPGVTVKLLDDAGAEVTAGEAGTIYFGSASAEFEYHNDPAKTRASRRPMWRSSACPTPSGARACWPSSSRRRRPYPEASLPELETYCADGLASCKRPRRIEFRADFPRTATGKLLRRQLRDEYGDNHER